MKKVDFENYQSPFSWRYGSEEMRKIFSEVNRRKTWRKVWVALAKAQQKTGLITKDELKEIEKNSQNIDIEKAQKIEKEIYHDVMAEIRVFADQSGKAGGKINHGWSGSGKDRGLRERYSFGIRNHPQSRRLFESLGHCPGNFRHF